MVDFEISTTSDAGSNREDQTPSNIVAGSNGEDQTPTNVVAGSNGEDQTQTQQVVGQKRNREQSKVWDHFTVVSGTSGITRRASCNYCGSSYACGSGNKNIGTTNLWSHLDGRCKKYSYRVVRDKNQKTLVYQPKKEGSVVDGVKSGTLKAIGYSNDACRKALASMVIVDEMAFRVVEGADFLNFFQVMQPLFKVPSRVTVARDCMKLYFEEKARLREKIKGQRVCLTTDTWTSIQNINYMCLTAHWIDDDWKLNKRIINFCQVASHKGEILGKVVENCLLDWGIDKILTLTVDNASSNDGVIRHLKGVTGEWKNVIFEHEFLHIRCCAHIVNLIVTEGLKEVNESIVRIRNAIRYVRSSPSRLHSFKRFAEKVKVSSQSLICLDIATRWNSTYKMLQAAEKFEKVFDRMKREDVRFSKYFEEAGKTSRAPTSLDWKNSRVFIKFLKLFYMVTLRFSGSLFVTCNSFFHELVNMQSKIVQLSRGRDPLLSGMAAGMMLKFDKYWGKFDKINFLLYVVVVLDPRYKLRYVKFCFGEVYDSMTASELTTKVRATFVRLFEYFSAQLKSSDVGSASPKSNTAQVVEDDVMAEDEHNELASKFKMHLMEEDNEESKDEVEKYLLDGCEEISDEKFNILDWWKTNGYKYRVLAMIAQEVLAVSVSMVASESAFSTGGRVLDPFRSSLAPTMVEALLCCQNWLRCSQEQIDLKDALEDIESYDEIESEFASRVTLDLDVDEDIEEHLEENEDVVGVQ